MQHILTADQFTDEYLNKLFKLADSIRKNAYYWRSALSGKMMGTLFFEPSTRTRWSSETAMLRLGGQVLSMESATLSSSRTKGETLADTLKNCSQLVDILVVRHPEANSIQEAAQYSDVPVINGGDGPNEHPTQTLLDYYTIKRHFPDLTNKKVLFTGDLTYSRTIRPLVKILERQKIQIFYAYPKSSFVKMFGPPQPNGVWEDEVNVEDYDIIYMTRMQRERYVADKFNHNNLSQYSSFVMTGELAEKMKEKSIIMHPGPRNGEVTTDVDENHRAVYFQQTKNGMWIRMALLFDLLNVNNK
jgi:aspartate carbamoyltransferase catalytic subunit